MELKVSLLTIGSEILDGRVLDANSNFICEKLSLHGMAVSEILSCTDREDEIMRAVDYLLEKSSFLIVSGGLGPTSDDLTREALARMADRELILDENVLKQLMALFEKRRRPFSPGNRKQALFPAGSRIIPNPIGTAAGFIMKVNGERRIATLPGVPRELKAMFLETVLPELLSSCQSMPPLSCRAMRVFGLPESLIGDRVDACRLDPKITVSYRATFPEIHVLLKARGNEGMLNDACRAVKAAIGQDFIFSEDLQCPFEKVLHELLLTGNKTVATAESCTGGMLGMYLTRSPGSSAWFKGGVVTYSNELKQSLLGIPQSVLESEGAVSHTTAKLMARAALERLSGDFGLSITGIAGPDGGSAEKPRGTFFVGLACGKETFSCRHFIDASREMVRDFAAYMAMDTLRRNLLGLKLPGEMA